MILCTVVLLGFTSKSLIIFGFEISTNASSSNFIFFQVSNAYLQFLKGPNTKIIFEFVKEMPKNQTQADVSLGSLNTLIIMWVCQLLFPVSTWAIMFIYS